MVDKKYERVIIINTFGIGDVLFATPLVRILKENMPDARIDFLCNERALDILKENRNIDDIIVYEKDDFRRVLKKSKIAFVKKILAFIKQLRGKRYDLAIDLSLGYQIAFILKLIGVKRRIGFNFRNRGRFLTEKLVIDGFNDKHVVDYYMDLLRLIGIDTAADKKIELDLSANVKKWADDFIQSKGLNDKTLVGIAPGGGKSWGEAAAYRRWPSEKFSYVALGLLKKRSDLVFMIFGSKEENFLCDRIVKNLGDSVINMCGKLSLPESISLIRKCESLLCNDGGILHIAVSQGVKTVSIFGPVYCAVYGPYPQGDKNKVAIAENVDCRPCYKSFKYSKCDSYRCLTEIDRDKVLKMMEESLNIS